MSWRFDSIGALVDAPTLDADADGGDGQQLMEHTDSENATVTSHLFLPQLAPHRRQVTPVPVCYCINRTVMGPD